MGRHYHRERGWLKMRTSWMTTLLTFILAFHPFPLGLGRGIGTQRREIMCGKKNRFQNCIHSTVLWLKKEKWGMKPSWKFAKTQGQSGFCLVVNVWCDLCPLATFEMHEGVWRCGWEKMPMYQKKAAEKVLAETVRTVLNWGNYT